MIYAVIGMATGAVLCFIVDLIIGRKVYSMEEPLFTQEEKAKHIMQLRNFEQRQHTARNKRLQRLKAKKFLTP